ncbi:MAG: glutamate racemase [Caldilineales bacterium]|nr:glutamate racemase [Caldilineales bacterium]
MSTSPIAPVAVFDSGVGGLSVWREVVALLPQESTLYLADQAHVPYGPRPPAEIAHLTRRAVAWLRAQGAKLVVIACNTASAAALNDLRAQWPDLPIVGMEPAVKPASLHTRVGKVGVIATPGTLTAPRFHSLVERFANGVEIHTQVCPGLVEWIEAGQVNGPEVEAQLRVWLAPLLAAGIDELVLGCTHYPFVMPLLRQIVGEGVEIIDPAPAVARQVQRLLQAHHLVAPPDAIPHHRFYTTGDPTALQTALQRLLGWEAAVEAVPLASSSATAATAPPANPTTTASSDASA